MIVRRLMIVQAIFAVLFVLAACDMGGGEPTTAAQLGSPLPVQISPLAAESLPTPNVGKSSVAGRLIDLATGEPIRNQNLSLPAVLCAPGVAEEDKRQECFYMIDEAFDPSALTDDDGNFIFRDIPAGEYVMLIGSLMTENVILLDELGRPIIWEATPDMVVELGDIVVEFGSE
jgi:hypothetical protein